MNLGFYSNKSAQSLHREMQNVFHLRRAFNGLLGHFFAIQNIYVNSNPAGLFFRNQKGARIFQWQEDINVVVIMDLSSTKLYLSFLKF